MQVEAAMQAPDGEWRVEIVRRGKTRWYRLINGDNELDWLAISSVERILGEAGVDMAQLVEAGANDSVTDSNEDDHGVA